MLRGFTVPCSQMKWLFGGKPPCHLGPSCPTSKVLSWEEVPRVKGPIKGSQQALRLSFYFSKTGLCPQEAAEG